MKASQRNGYGMDLKFLNYAQSNQVLKPWELGEVKYHLMHKSFLSASFQVKNPRDSSVSYAAATFVMHWFLSKVLHYNT